MNWLDRDTASVSHPFAQHSPWLGDERTVITRGAGGSWLYDVDGIRVLDGASSRAVAVAGGASVTVGGGAPVAVAGGASAPGASKDPALPPPDPDQPGGPSPTDPEGPTDPKPTDPTDPTGPDEPPALDQPGLAADGTAG